MRGSTKSSRSVAVNALKRELIREAAKRVFLARGLSAASVREIALQAGYTTGAIYFHYASKEEIYADVLSASLSAPAERNSSPNTLTASSSTRTAASSESLPAMSAPLSASRIAFSPASASLTATA